ncbi:hypothetical protein AB0H82_06760 [Streptomyces sp. NPDC050732]|uniref:ArnT family glycosyltransferase n=1 Tax=Streptomyces sp. NPDC050732 TaxID=3154632 RepID=UPI00341D8C60
MRPVEGVADGRSERADSTDAHVTLVTLPRGALEGAAPHLLGPTALVGVGDRGPTLLLTGCGVHEARDRLARAGIDPGNESAVLRPARRTDLFDRYRPAADPPPKSPRHPALLPARSRRAAALGLLFTLALGARLVALDTSYDVFVDELYYTGIARNLAAGHGLTSQGEPFALHPPALFAVLAAVLRCAGGHDDPLPTVLALRAVIAVTGALLVVGVTALLHRTVRRAAVAWAAGLLLTVDPFLNRFDSRVMLETQATAAAAAGMLVLAHTPATPRGRCAGAVAGGLLFAVSVTTKDWYVLITVAPVLALATLSTGVARRTLLTAAAVAVTGYATYVGAICATGGWPAWQAQKLDGLHRVVGLKQTTGFHRPEATTGFTDRLLANAGQLGVSYVLILLGAAATCRLLWQLGRRPWLFAGLPGRSLIAVWGAFALPALLYAVVWGTCEEQMFYPALVTGAAALAVTADALPTRGGGLRATNAGCRRTAALAVLPALALAAGLTVDTVTWAQVHNRQDDAYRRLIAWTARHLPPDARVAVTEETPTLLLPRTVKAKWSGPEDLAGHRVDHLLVSDTQVAAQGSAAIAPGLLAAVERRARLAHRELGPSNRALKLYDLRGMTASPTPPPCSPPPVDKPGTAPEGCR